MATIYNIQIKTTSPFIAYSPIELTEIIGEWFVQYRNPTNGLGFENTTIKVIDITNSNKRKSTWTYINKPFDFIIDNQGRIVLSFHYNMFDQQKDLKKILTDISTIHNDTSDIEFGSDGVIELYLLNNSKCNQDLREEILQAIYNYYTN